MASSASHQLVVTVLQAQNLPIPTFGALKPYVAASVGRGAFKTPVCAGPNPRFDHDNVLRLPCTLSDHLTLTVYDQNMLSDDDALGACHIMVEKHADGGLYECKQPLLRGSSASAMNLAFTLQLYNLDGSPFGAGTSASVAAKYYDPARDGPHPSAPAAPAPAPGPAPGVPRYMTAVPPGPAPPSYHATAPPPGAGAPGMPPPGMPHPGMPMPGMPHPGMPMPGMPPPGMPHPGMPPHGYVGAPAPGGMPYGMAYGGGGYGGPPPTAFSHRPPPMDPGIVAASMSSAEAKETEVREVFARYDANHDGMISHDELTRMLTDLGFGPDIIRNEVTALQHGGLLYQGRAVTFQEFATYYNSLQQRRWMASQAAGVTPSGYGAAAAGVPAGYTVTPGMTGAGAGAGSASKDKGKGKGKYKGKGKFKSNKKGIVKRSKGTFKLKFKGARKGAEKMWKGAKRVFK